ncbi:EF-hand domain-containing protein [Kibdelosporangium phytohabitans]|uniref:Calcium-binding protein n=1 Tax=Kibdelosporangium phytohabitans TaxID=860235 RepID=A0A0N9HV75_9PSEU|nr:EF-hand domain-containing protein [Kibdelosporangium phytohabitans]ALG09121.1 calcium-binding protein [Kibdelosporangium phytohabitans]MBE1469674.1 Ca2+-binding EF-hand superfamily protein [Kibdelosporangium phytohabitans]
MAFSEFLDRKLARRFHTFDYDGDGDIDRSDFMRSATAVADEFRHPAGSPARAGLVERSLGLWEHLAVAAGVSSDDSITVDEYKEAFAEGLLVTEESFEQGYRPFLEALMSVCDIDNDGQLSVEEYVRWTGALMNLSETDARDIHRRLDTDNDGYVTTEDLLHAIHEFYFDEDPDGVGSWLLGPLG